MDKDLFDRALGDEPLVRLDFDAIEIAAAKSYRRRRLMVSAVTAIAAVALTGGMAVAVAMVASSEPPDPGTAQLAVPATGVTSTPTTKSKKPDATAVPATRTMAYCYRTADIGTAEPGQHVLIGVAGGDPDGRGDAAVRILGICKQAWEQNYYNWQPGGEGQVFAAPPLVACVLDARAVEAQSGAAAVFPGGPDTCAKLGLPVAQLAG